MATNNRAQAVQLITMYFGMRTSLLPMGCSPWQTIFATRKFVFFNFTVWCVLIVYWFVSFPYLSFYFYFYFYFYFSSKFGLATLFFPFQICTMHEICFHW
jgi:hypothetical protein